MKKCIMLLILFSCSVCAENRSAAVINASLGLKLLQQGLYAESKARLLRALHDDARIAAPWYSMAYFLEKTGHMLSADRYYRQAIHVAPHSGAAKNNYGVFLCRQGKYPEAIRAFMSAVKEPNYLHVASAYANAGICAAKIPNASLAKFYFKKAAENNPHFQRKI